MSDISLSHVPEEVLEKAEKLDLRYITDSIRGISREGSKTSPIYTGSTGERVNDSKTLKRIKDLVIPPAWTGVWISPYANTHLQATGIDQKGRKQYIYHKEWERICQEAKFDRVEFFGKHLPTIREAVERDMTTRGLNEKRVIATVVWLLEHTFIRIGNEEYAKENQSFGLTTLRNKHVDVDGDRIRFTFKGKSGIDHEKDITNPTVVKTIRKCIELPGYEVFQYLNEEHQRHTVDSAEVNQYLQDTTGEQITAKDFRTWGGTMLSANYLCQMETPKTKDDKKKNMTQVVKKVSKNLGNTPTVCRSYYIHPTIFRTYEEDILVPHIKEYRDKPQKEDNLKPTEFAVLELLRNYPAS
ncbi:MAG: DNA topoisomerase IB [Patescibacteria group bacterium]